MRLTPEAIFQRTYGLTDAKMAEAEERGRARAAERAEALGTRRSPWIGRTKINQHSTLNHVQQFGRRS